MRHRVAGRKLGRTTEHRIALLRNLSTALFDKEKITTTLAKAKELRPFAEKLLTISKKETLHARRQVARHIHDRAVVTKVFDTLSARYAQRPGGYTRIIKLGPRRGDQAEMAIIELVGSEAELAAESKGKTRRGAKAKAKAKAKPAAKAKPKKKAKTKKAAAKDEAEPEPKKKARATKKKTTKKTTARKTEAKSDDSSAASAKPKPRKLGSS
jgi:large subunit ribosomal protein L17